LRVSFASAVKAFRRDRFACRVSISALKWMHCVGRLHLSRRILFDVVGVRHACLGVLDRVAPARGDGLLCGLDVVQHTDVAHDLADQLAASHGEQEKEGREEEEEERRLRDK